MSSKSDEDFSIVWQPYGGRGPTGRPINAGESLAFPYLIRGEACSAMRTGKPVELGGRELLSGIVFGYSDDPPAAIVSKVALNDALNDLVQVFHAPSLEILVLDVCANIRESLGASAGRMALHNAQLIVPNSSMTKSDFIMITNEWLREIRSDSPLSAEEQREVCIEIADAYKGIHLRLVNPDAIEVLVYWQFIALSILGARDQRDAFLTQQVVRHVTSAALAARVKDILGRDSVDLHAASW